MPSTYSWETCPLGAPCHFGLIEIHSQIWAQRAPASQHAAFLSVHDNLRILPCMHNHIWVCPCCTIQSAWIIYALWARFHSQKWVRSPHKSAKRIFWWMYILYFPCEIAGQRSIIYSHDWGMTTFWFLFSEISLLTISLMLILIWLFWHCGFMSRQKQQPMDTTKLRSTITVCTEWGN